MASSKKRKADSRHFAPNNLRKLGACHELLEYHVERCLRRRGLKTLNGYAWKNEYDPNLVGIAMWESDMPREHSGALHKRQVAGEDFYGLMTLARLAIGMTLFSSRRGLLGVVTGPYYWLHSFNSMVNLSTASDRLREVLTWTLYGMSADDYTGRLRKQRVAGKSLWPYPFENVAEEVSDWRIEKAAKRDLKRLIPGMASRAGRVAANRARRNKLVHRLATLDGEIEKHRGLLEKELERAESASVPTLLATQARSWSNANAKVNSQNRLLCDWYRDLVLLANAVFQIEYWSRRREL